MPCALRGGQRSIAVLSLLSMGDLLNVVVWVCDDIGDGFTWWHSIIKHVAPALIYEVIRTQAQSGFE
jgi:hypothetical protein